MKTKKHGMTTKQARQVKLRGHAYERKVADKLKGDVIPGRGKADIILKNQTTISLKSGKARIQFLQVQSEKGFGKFPNDIATQLRNLQAHKQNYAGNPRKEISEKRKIADCVNKLNDSLINKNNYHDFLQKTIFHCSCKDELVDLLALRITDSERFVVYTRSSVMNALAKHTYQCPNEGRTCRGQQVGSQKLNFNFINTKGNDKLLGWVETANGKTKSFIRISANHEDLLEFLGLYAEEHFTFSV
jgi:hypothetical protein